MACDRSARVPASTRRRADEARRVSDLLRRDIIESGSGAKLPSEDALIRTFAVSRNTVREALELLRREGLLERIPGAGTFSAPRSGRYRFDLAQGFMQGVLSSERVHRKVLSVEQRAAPPSIVRDLELAPDEPAIVLDRLVTLDGTPLYHSTSWFPPFVGVGLLRTDLAAELGALLTALGYELGRTQFSLEAVRAGEADAATLDIAEGAPMILFGVRTWLRDGRPVELSFARMRSHRFEISGGVESAREEVAELRVETHRSC